MRALLSYHRIFLLVLLTSFFTVSIKAQTLKDLQDAFANKDTLQVIRLIKKGANINELDKFGSTFLITSSRWGDLESIKFLLRHGATINKPRTPKGRTALIVACAYYGSREVCEYLISHGANVNAQADDGSTALMYAAEYWKSDVVELLLAKGAKVIMKDKAGKTALDYLKKNSVDEDIKKMLTKFVVDKQATEALLTKAAH